MALFLKIFAISLAIQLIIGTFVLHLGIYPSTPVKELFISVVAALFLSFVRYNKNV